MTSYQLRVLGTKLYDELVVTAAYQAIQESRNSRSLGSNSLKSQVEKVDVYSLNVDAQKLLGAHTLRYGLEYAHNDVASRATFTNITNGSQTPADTRYPDGANTMDWLAAYITDQWVLTEEVILNAGARLNQVNLSSKFVSKEFFPFPFDKAEQANTALTGNLGSGVVAPLVFQAVIAGVDGFPGSQCGRYRQSI